jgi:uncharacterized protein YjgD (DUF1641 family)
MEIPPRNPRAELISRLEQAPVEHAEALLSAYQLLQALHDRGAIDMARGAVGSSDQLIEIVVEAAKAPESVQGLRNLLLMAKMFGALEPETVKTFTQAIPLALHRMTDQPEPPGLFRLLKDFFWNQDFRHGLAAVNTMLSVFGQSICKRTRAIKESHKSNGSAKAVSPPPAPAPPPQAAVI